MTPMQQQASAVLNALDEGKVLAVIGLYDAGQLPRTPAGRRADIGQQLVFTLGVEADSVNYWLDDYFKVGDETPTKVEADSEYEQRTGRLAPKHQREGV